MRPKDIQVGKIYRNRGKGRTFRRVVAIGNEHRPTRWFSDYPPKEPGVLYRDQVGRENRPYLSSFAQWCKEEEIRVCRGLLSVGGEMSRDFWLAFLFFFNALWVLVELACGMIWMPIFNILAAIYILDVILDFDAWALEDLK